MKKLVKNLNVRNYDEVEDLIFELLQEHYGIERHSFDCLEPNIEYVVGTINIVKLGDNPNTLKHLHHDNQWSNDVPVTESYEYAEYYRLDKMNELCKNTLSGSWSETYNFERILKSMGTE